MVETGHIKNRYKSLFGPITLCHNILFSPHTCSFLLWARFKQIKSHHQYSHIHVPFVYIKWYTARVGHKYIVSVHKTTRADFGCVIYLNYFFCFKGEFVPMKYANLYSKFQFSIGTFSRSDDKHFLHTTYLVLYNHKGKLLNI